ncbi:MAG TPA: chromate transporter [Firmicutes bacterium]|nr:chromate transporter [Bacillota bacterium]
MTTILFALFLSFFRIGLFGFGGGYAMLPLMELEIVQSRGWINPFEFIDIIAVAEMTPGAIAINAATFVGYRVAGLAGAILSTIGVITPPLLLVLPVGWLVIRYQKNRRLEQALQGIHPAVLSLIVLAAFVLGGEAMIDLQSYTVAAVSLILLFYTRMHPIILIILGAAAGIILYGF